MAQEAKRGCGFRKMNGLYLVGGYIGVPCDRLPLEVGACPVCGEGIKLMRSVKEVNPLKLFGRHGGCGDQARPCFVCDPRDEVAFIMGVGSRYYTPQSFLEEARQMGVSKRIPAMPKKLKLGETVVYLAHPKAIEVPPTVQPDSLAALLDKTKYRLGIICAFIPQRVEKILWRSQASEEVLKDLERRNITPVLFYGDPDHK